MTLVRIPRARKRRREYYMTARDQAAFSAALKGAYPDLVFGQMRRDRVLTYFASMELIDNSSLQDSTGYAWRRPGGWEPDWALRYPDIPEIGYVVANLPDSNFNFDSRTDIMVKDLGAGRKRYSHSLSTIGAVYDQLDPDTRRFIEKVYRLLRKFTTNKFLVVEPDSGRVVRQVSDYFRSAGHDVLFNCRKNKDYFVTARGSDEASGKPYFYLPTEDWSPPDWLVALDARAEGATTSSA
jgi:hypothetical protein